MWNAVCPFLELCISVWWVNQRSTLSVINSVTIAELLKCIVHLLRSIEQRWISFVVHKRQRSSLTAQSRSNSVHLLHQCQMQLKQTISLDRNGKKHILTGVFPAVSFAKTSGLQDKIRLTTVSSPFKIAAWTVWTEMINEGKATRQSTWSLT